MATVLLLNAPGNKHLLGSRILALWLKSQCISARTAGEFLDLDDTVATVRDMGPTAVLISTALSEQREGVERLVQRIERLPNVPRPMIFVGGHAVKSGMMSPIRGVEFVTDIHLVLSRLRMR